MSRRASFAQRKPFAPSALPEIDNSRFSQMDSERHVRFMKLAVEEARKCPPEPTAFCVGAAVVSKDGELLSAGHSRKFASLTKDPANEMDGTHAETAAIHQLRLSKGDSTSADRLMMGADMYTTLEPCSVRASGKAPCSRFIVERGFGRVIVGSREPDDFVKCEGTKVLEDAGIEVVYLEELAEECLEVAKRDHKQA